MDWNALALGRLYIGNGQYELAAAFIALVFGAGLAYNCARGLMSREGMFDQESTDYMTLMQWLGMILGLGASIGGGIALYHLWTYL